MRYAMSVSYEELCDMAKRYGDFHPDEKGRLDELVSSLQGRGVPIPHRLASAMAGYIDERRDEQP
jgi:hypothetical protein